VVQGARLLGDDHRVVGEGPAPAAIVLGDARAQQPDLAGLAPELAVDALLLGPALVLRDRLALEERAREVA
jgi:hypothetical protein